MLAKTKNRFGKILKKEILDFGNGKIERRMALSSGKMRGIECWIRELWHILTFFDILKYKIELIILVGQILGIGNILNGKEMTKRRKNFGKKIQIVFQIYSPEFNVQWHIKINSAEQIKNERGKFMVLRGAKLAIWPEYGNRKGDTTF